MLKAYEVIVEDGQIKWLNEQPNVKSARAILTFLEDVPIDEKADTLAGDELKSQKLKNPEPTVKRRSFPTNLAGKVEIVGDIVSPIVDEEDWECLK
jgi:hypothetical protein